MKIEILAQPNQPTGHLQEALRKAASKVNVQAQISTTANFAAFSHISVNPSQTPIVIINGKVEFSQCLPEPSILQRRLFEIDKKGGDII